MQIGRIERWESSMCFQHHILDVCSFLVDLPSSTDPLRAYGTMPGLNIHRVHQGSSIDHMVIQVFGFMF